MVQIESNLSLNLLVANTKQNKESATKSHYDKGGGISFWKENNKILGLNSVRLWVAVSDPATVSSSPTLPLLAVTLHMTVSSTESQGHHVKTQLSEGLGQNRPWVMPLGPRIKAKDLECTDTEAMSHMGLEM